MKKLLVVIIASGLMLSSCISASRMTGSPAAVQAGAAIGGVFGAIVGNRMDGYTGSDVGALVGTIAGAAIGNAVSTPKTSKRHQDYNDEVLYDGQMDNVEPSKVRIDHIRFVDENHNKAIDANETCQLIFELENTGDLPAFDVTPILENVSGNKHITFSEAKPVAYMEKGTRIRYKAYIYGAKKLRDGQVDICIYAMESNGACSESHTFTLNCHAR